MNIKTYFLENKDIQSISLLHEYIDYMNTQMMKKSGWKSYVRVHYNSAVYTLVKDYQSDMISASIIFFEEKGLGDTFNSTDIIDFWSKDISSLFTDRSGNSIWGYVMYQMLDVYYQILLDDNNSLIWVDTTFQECLKQYLKIHNQDYDLFVDKQIQLLTVKRYLDEIEEQKSIIVQERLVQNIEGIVRDSFPDQLDIWKQKSRWLKLVELIEFCAILKKNVYQEFSLDFIYPNSRSWKPVLEWSVTQAQLEEVIKKEIQHTLTFIQDIDSHKAWKRDLFISESMIRLETVVGIDKTTKIISFVWDYVSTLQTMIGTIEQDSHPEDYQQMFQDQAQQGLSVLVDMIYQDN